MILLLGGTSETAGIAEKLAAAGYRVLVSTATDVCLNLGTHPAIQHRRGPLSKEEFKTLIRELGITAIVNATHPYASAIRRSAPEIAREEGILYLSYLRPGYMQAEIREENLEGVVHAEDHSQGARLAFEFNRPVLLTIGSRNILPYGLESKRTGVPLVARVLDHPDSLLACRQAGLHEDHIITGRGPFSVEANQALIRKFGIGVLVTKDSGDAGGVGEKLQAARLEQCRVVLIGRPPEPANDSACNQSNLANPASFACIDELFYHLQQQLPVTDPTH